MPLMTRSLAELIGTFWLVLGGCGSAVLAAAFPDVGIGLLGVSFAFGLTVLTMAYAIGHISGCHLNPAVSLGLAVGGRFSFADLPVYIIAQVLGAIAAAALIYFIASDVGAFNDQMAAFTLGANSLAVNGYAELSPGGYGMGAALATEAVLTAMFLFIILGATDKRGHGVSAGLAIGLTLTLIHLISIPVTNTSVNPARSTGPALILAFLGEGKAMGQLWLFWVAPLAGAALGGLIYRLFEQKEG
ncbi:MIP family channel protein [Thiocystis violascens DSM 198]|uniref:MIP family channel protein n=2 Tax=Thiocystis violascens TaxID=73141 RepID=I3YC95_THIV6|nr:MIP family channel protein [Thiocystis violascens DSM 198]